MSNFMNWNNSQDCSSAAGCLRKKVTSVCVCVCHPAHLQSMNVYCSSTTTMTWSVLYCDSTFEWVSIQTVSSHCFTKSLTSIHFTCELYRRAMLDPGNLVFSHCIFAVKSFCNDKALDVWFLFCGMRGMCCTSTIFTAHLQKHKICKNTIIFT